MPTAEFTNVVKRNMMAKRFRLHTLHEGKKVALGQAIDPYSQMPFGVFSIDMGGEVYGGTFYSTYLAAMADYNTRTQPPQEEITNPENLIDWQQLYETHRIGFYKGWMVVETHEGSILAYAPSIEWEDSVYSDLEYLQDNYKPISNGEANGALLVYIDQEIENDAIQTKHGRGPRLPETTARH